ncbi:MAG: hypothetical protein KBA30_10795 [Clostridia bacterium]|nr:hypothetical protein [Clostridia bacterium]
MVLYHYYERTRGPLRSLSELAPEVAREILDGLRAAGDTFAARRTDGYLERRVQLERQVRELFIAKGGRPDRLTPHYFVVESCPWLETWYKEPGVLRLPVDRLDPDRISFTYGDMFPTFSPVVRDGREYRGKVYTYTEILDVIGRYGLPQSWNADGSRGPERYIEAHVWTDLPEDILSGFLK